MNRILLSAAAIAFCAVSSAQNVIGIPELGTGYPRMIDGEECRQEITSLLETVPGATAMKELEDRSGVDSEQTADVLGYARDRCVCER